MKRRVFVFVFASIPMVYLCLLLIIVLPKNKFVLDNVMILAEQSTYIRTYRERVNYPPLKPSPSFWLSLS